ncbi:hypothetical protein [Methanoculleus sp.]|uniref:hypothetical protein n=1 Tax=Methanoculleus sp. TaxID=90427 RepID=UPI0025EE381F|nr:hypothetical protein [Methanoculleus sp.]MCK9319765.1 hypothetical protein [Methanoculleus sp.]
MAKHILTIFTKNRLKTDKALEYAKKVQEHLDNEYKVLIFDKNVDKVEFFEVPQEQEIQAQDDLEIDLELEKGENENE